MEKGKRNTSISLNPKFNVTLCLIRLIKVNNYFRLSEIVLFNCLNVNLYFWQFSASVGTQYF